MKSSKTYIDIYLVEIAASLSEMPDALRQETLNEMRGHLEAMMESRRTDGMDETTAWESVRRDFGEPNRIGKAVANEWTREPRYETEGEPLSKREVTLKFASAIAFSSLAILLVKALSGDFPVITNHIPQLCLLVFTLACAGVGCWKWHRGGEKWTFSNGVMWALIFLQITWANVYLAMPMQDRQTTFVRSSPLFIILSTGLLSFLTGRSKKATLKTSRPWNSMPRYQTSPVAAEQEYHLYPKIGLIMGVTISCCAALLTSWHSAHLSSAIYQAFFFIVLALIQVLWSCRRIW